MKKIILCSLFTVVLFLLRANGQESKSYKLPKKTLDQFTIVGKIDGRDTGRIILGYVNSDGKHVNDTAFLKNGNFSFKGKINQPTLAGIVGNITSGLIDDPNRTAFFLEPGKLQVKLQEGGFGKIEMTGSKTQDDFYNLKKSYASYMDRFDKIDDSATIILQKADLNPDSVNLQFKRDSIWKERTKMTEAISSVERDFLSTNKTSYLTPFLLDRYVGTNGISVDSATKIFENLSPNVRQSDLGFAIKQLIYSKKLANVGDAAANFQAIDINGKTISLAEFKGKKFVLLDFWYAGCPPCRELSPSLKKLYSEFKDHGLEIIGMAHESNSRWRAAIAEDGTGAWRHLMLSSIKKEKKGLPVDLSYNLSYYPTLVLISKEGVIIHRSTGNVGDKGLDVYRKLLSK